jgi:hypothetical protein
MKHIIREYIFLKMFEEAIRAKQGNAIIGNDKL